MLEPLLGPAFVLLTGGLLYSLVSRRRTRIQVWEDAAVSCGLEVVEAASGINPRLKARSGAVEVRIRRSGEPNISLIAVKADWPPDFHQARIRPHAMYQVTQEIEVGDGPLDGLFAIDGPVRLVSALLDEETRRRLSALGGRLELSSGELRVRELDSAVPRVLPPLLDLARRLSGPLDVPRRLAENARQDPLPKVRLHNLLVLLRELPDDPATAAALRAARSDPSPEVRLRMAKALGAEGHGILRELAEGMEDDAVTAEAVSALGRELPFESACAILEQASKRRRLRTAQACLRAIGRSEGPGAVDVLAEAMARERGDLASAAAQALGVTGSLAAEAPLIQALQRQHADLRVAAADVLGRIGTAAAVLPLKEAAERHPLDLDLRRTARQAIAGIQSRLQGASPGQLSLAGAEAGQLSLAGAEAGQLSLAEDPAGRLSLPPGERPE